MNLRQQCLDCLMTYPYICTYITFLCYNHKERILYLSAEQLPDDGFAIGHDSILSLFVYKPHCNMYLHPSIDESSNTEADGKNASFNPAWPPVWPRIEDTQHVDHLLTCQPTSNEYFNIFDNEIDLCSPLSCQQQYQLAHWCIKYNMYRAAINELFRNPTIATVSNITSSHTVFKWLSEMYYALRMNLQQSGKVWHNCLADPNNLHRNDYRHSFYYYPVECTEFVMQQPALR